jgi:hypothetical protein
LLSRRLSDPILLVNAKRQEGVVKCEKREEPGKAMIDEITVGNVVMVFWISQPCHFLVAMTIDGKFCR